LFGDQKGKPFRWGETPPKWFMKEIAKSFQLMGQNREMIHAVDISEKWTIFITICPRDQSQALGVEMAEVAKRRFPAPGEDA
jgi:hypothetical protein